MKKRNAFRPAVGLIAAALLAAPTAAIVYVMQTDEDMVRQSPLIVYGEVVDTTPARLDGRPATDAHVRVENVLKGRLSDSVVAVRQPGGFDGGTGLRIVGLPMLSGGDRVLLFLDEDGGAYRTVSLGLGIFFETSRGGRKVLVREAPHLASRRVADERAVRDSGRFRRWIGDRVAGREGRVDYLAADLPDGPRGIASPYTVYRSSACLQDPNADIRWRKFDTGGTLTFSVYGSQEGATDTMAGVNAAVAAWNGSGAKVSVDATAAEGDAPRSGLHDLEAAVTFGAEAHDNTLATTAVAWNCYIDGISTAYTIPGTSRKARPPYSAVIQTRERLASVLEASDDAAADFAEIMAHELGHALGLDHSADETALMRAVRHGGGRGASLRTDDVNGIKYLYPSSGSDGGGDDSGGSDDEPPAADCTLVAPYWSGPTGGFTVRPAPGSNSVSLTCGRRTTEYMAEDGLVTRLVKNSCRGTGLQLTGAAAGGWYWQHGDRNAAVAPLVCSDTLAGPSAVVPGGVTADATDDGTLIRHDTAQLIGIVPHLAGNECGEYVTPYWQGDGGVVVRPAEGRETVKIRVQCGRTWSTMKRSAGEDGVVAELVRKSYCTDDEGDPKQGRLTVTGAAPGGWYWISGERNAAVAPLMCADLLGGPGAVDPGGVISRALEDGTYFEHEVNSLIGVVPHLVPNAEDD